MKKLRRKGNQLKNIRKHGKVKKRKRRNENLLKNICRKANKRKKLD